MRLAIIGAGYVGLVTGACFSDFGFDTVCIDSDAGRIAMLQAGRIPIHEPGLEQLVNNNLAAGRLAFSTSCDCVGQADVVFIAVGTPSRRGDDEADMAFVHQAARDIAGALKDYTVVVTKSTVPVGTARQIEAIIKAQNPRADFDMAANPEFLREGSAVSDFINPDRIVIGAEDERARERLRQLYLPLVMRRVPIVFTGLESGELIKYAANAYLAMRIAFVNELADLCGVLGGDIQAVTHGMGLDARIGPSYLQPGPGFGGSCLPKDIRAVVATARAAGRQLTIVETVKAANDRRVEGLVGRVAAAVGGDLKNKRIAVFGLAFKADTDDMRRAASLTLVPALTAAGASVAACDPVAMAAARRHFTGIDWSEEPYEAATGADAVVVLTEWNLFRGLDLERLAQVMKTPLVVDFRNIYLTGEMARAGFTYISLGRAPVMAGETGSEARRAYFPGTRELA